MTPGEFDKCHADLFSFVLLHSLANENSPENRLWIVWWGYTMRQELRSRPPKRATDRRWPEPSWQQPSQVQMQRGAPGGDPCYMEPARAQSDPARKAPPFKNFKISK